MPEIIGRDRLIETLIDRLADDRRIVLYGPIGSGKTTILREILRRLREAGRACALAPVTATLGDITTAMLGIYPEFDGTHLSRRQVRGRMKLAAEDRPGALLLDHVRDIGTASRGFLQSIWTLKVGVLAAVDVEFPRDMRRLQALRMRDLTMPVPPLGAAAMRRVFDAAAASGALPRPLSDIEWRSLLGAARGRPGWIRLMGDLATDERYWSDEGLHTGRLRADAASAMAARYLGDAVPAFSAHAADRAASTGGRIP